MALFDVNNLLNIFLKFWAQLMLLIGELLLVLIISYTEMTLYIKAFEMQLTVFDFAIALVVQLIDISNGLADKNLEVWKSNGSVLGVFTWEGGTVNFSEKV